MLFPATFNLFIKESVAGTTKLKGSNSRWVFWLSTNWAGNGMCYYFIIIAMTYGVFENLSRHDHTEQP
jgi:hypothetical protein